jgi:hypothetical protein
MEATSTIRAARRSDIPSLVLLWTAMMEENARHDPRLAPHPRGKEHMADRFTEWLQDANRHVVPSATPPPASGRGTAGRRR